MVQEVRRRLQMAALMLYEERGYDQATAAQIAERAGVTERTFFRHFPDKREILFGGDAVFCDAVAAAVRDAPAGLGALDMLMFAFQSVEQLYIDNRSFSVPRRRLIASTPALQEREVAKIRKVVATLCEALGERGVEARRAMLAAQVGMAALGQAVEAWMNEDSGDLCARIRQSFADVRAPVGGRALCPKGSKPFARLSTDSVESETGLRRSKRLEFGVRCAAAITSLTQNGKVRPAADIRQRLLFGIAVVRATKASVARAAFTRQQVSTGSRLATGRFHVSGATRAPDRQV